ncbi:MAG: DUF1499 domain-containing protein [Candidatus Tokpelaia sp.]|uniref:DUF1499 domain-containing protein n=1 Tax=Candidatus Tokpelaia sp. TaxID=2233777 RepID=UPI001239A026|nr:DUF1499 domain-containing protein [Candidatus Tokpelaia sp.]KAA6204742.1 MAG: DUF1499 domain-containing protein [Candidatus Tokpelaia sp.]KAA6207212.1 MAG: DUF1499 domain-containing protein [Candidatus Tokpelaia sp.]KAA6405272.1 DUF1499 domain-containing protein [Candidatus Tokpelaia sp.]
MRRKYIRPQSKAALMCPRFGLFAVALLLVALVLHRFGFIQTVNLPYIMALVGISAALSLIFAFFGLRALWQEGYKGGLSCVKGGLLAFMALAPLLFIGAAWFAFPPLYDITTDFDTPPAFLAGSRPADALPVKAGFTPAAAEEQWAAWPQLSGRRYDGSPDTVLKAVYAVLKAKNWTISGEQGKAGEDSLLLVEVVAKTFVLGFVSDIIIRLSDEGDTSFVDMRSASRYLPRDYGINARFIADFMNRLDAEILSLPVDETRD